MARHAVSLAAPLHPQHNQLTEATRQISALRTKLEEANVVKEDLLNELDAKASELDRMRFKCGNYQTLETRAKLAEDELEALRPAAAKLERYVCNVSEIGEAAGVGLERQAGAEQRKEPARVFTTRGRSALPLHGQ